MRRLIQFSLYTLFFGSSFALSIQAASAQQASTTTVAAVSTLSKEKAQQLLDFAKVWRDLKYLHTGPAYQQRDWDKAFINTAAKIKAAQNDAELKSAFTEFMADLNDPAFSLVRPQAAEAHHLQTQLQLRWLAQDTAYLSLPDLSAIFQSDYYGNPQPDPALQQAQQAITAQAQNLIVDLRQMKFNNFSESQLSKLLSSWFSQDLDLPLQQSRQHIGYVSQTRDSSGGFSNSVVSKTPASIKARGQRDLKLVFIVNQYLPMPAALLALRNRGQAAIISVGGVNLNKILGSTGRYIAGIPFTYSLYHLHYPNSDDGKWFDLQLQDTSKITQADLDQSAMKLLVRLNSPQTPTAASTHQSAFIKAMPAEPAYAEMTLPDRAWRELAVIKLWAVIDSFFPYMDLIPDRTWDNAAKRALNEMQEISEVRDYEQVIKRMLAPLSDSHFNILNLNPPTSYQIWPAVRFVWAEDQVVVKTLEDPQLVTAGIAPGDVLVKFADSPVLSRIDHLRRHISSSTVANSYRDALGYLLVGEPDSLVTLQFKKPDGRLIELDYRRKSASFTETQATLSHHPINQQLAYIDLASISEAGLSEALTLYKNYPALILDLRNYPKLLPYSFVNILGSDRLQNLALLRTPILSTDIRFGEKLVREYHQQSYKKNGQGCSQPKIVLINEETQSRAEHIGLFIKELCPTIFIGRPSAGTNGDATYTLLPGNIEVQFSGQSIMHANGEQLQRRGLQPAVVVNSKLEDLRTGIDAELAAAINYAMQHYAPSAALTKKQAVSSRPPK